MLLIYPGSSVICDTLTIDDSMKRHVCPPVFRPLVQFMNDVKTLSLEVIDEGKEIKVINEDSRNTSVVRRINS